MPIYVVGAGPGDPELITIKAARILAEADVVAYGDLVPGEIANRHAPRAVKLKIGHKRAEHDAAVAKLIDMAKAGLNVVVLKNGDPTIYGRGHQICEAAAAAGVPCRIIPGVSSFTAASALFGVPLTSDSKALALLSYPDVDAESLKAHRDDTIVIFMMGRRLPELGELLASALCPHVLTYVCNRISTGGSCKPLKARELGGAEVEGPVLLIVKPRSCYTEASNTG